MSCTLTFWMGGFTREGPGCRQNATLRHFCSWWEITWPQQQWSVFLVSFLREPTAHLQNYFSKKWISSYTSTNELSLSPTPIYLRSPLSLIEVRPHLNATPLYWTEPMEIFYPRWHWGGTPWTTCQSITGLTHKENLQFFGQLWSQTLQENPRRPKENTGSLWAYSRETPCSISAGPCARQICQDLQYPI